MAPARAAGSEVVLIDLLPTGAIGVPLARLPQAGTDAVARAGRVSRNGVAFSNASATRNTVGLGERLADQLDRDRQPAGAKPRAHRDRRVAGDVERHREARRGKRVPCGHFVDLRRLGGLRRGQHDIEPGHRGLQLGTQLAPAAHRLDIVDARNERAEHQPALHPFAEIAQPRPRPFLIGRGALGDRDQGAAGAPILQRRQLHLADLGPEPAERGDRGVDAAPGPRR